METSRSQNQNTKQSCKQVELGRRMEQSNARLKSWLVLFVPLFSCLHRWVLCHWYQSNWGLEVHLFPPYWISEGHGYVHLPNTAGLGQGAETWLQHWINQYHCWGLCDREPVCTNCHCTEWKAAETDLVILLRFI